MSQIFIVWRLLLASNNHFPFFLLVLLSQNFKCTWLPSLPYYKVWVCNSFLVNAMGMKVMDAISGQVLKRKGFVCHFSLPPSH